MLYALPYVLLVIFYGILAVLYHQTEDEQKRTYIKWACVLVFVLFFGFRGFIFFDWASYYPTFNAMPTLATLFSTDAVKWGSEPGFVLLATICKTIAPSYHFFVLVCCLVNTALLVNFFRRYSDNLPLSFVLFLGFSGIVFSTDLIRNSLSVLLFINSIPFIQARRPLPYFLMNLLCISFHYSGLFFLPMYFVLHRRFNKWFLLTMIVGANVMFLLHIPILKTIIGFLADFVDPSVKYWMELYTKMDFDDGFGIGVGYLERLITAFLLFCYLDKLRSIRPENNIFINSVILYLMLFLVFAEFRVVSMRLSNLFSFGYWIIWADLIWCFAIRNNRRLFVAFMGVYCILKVYGSSNFMVADYENILFGAKSYNERLILFRQHGSDKTGI